MAIAIPGGRMVMAFLLTVAFSHSYAQDVPPERCATMQVLEQRFKLHPALKTRFQTREKAFQQIVNQRLRTVTTGTQRAETFLTVPVVVHIVMADPSQITDAQIQAQLDTLNKDYAGTNGDTVNIPSWFKPLFGKAGIQFGLATQTPNGEPTSGIERISSGHGAFNVFTNDVKHTVSGGIEAWNTNSYLNLWICQLAAPYLGLATFPDDGDSANQGAMIDYRTLPGGSLVNFNGGKTVSHEIGHYFNLYHIWGDDGGSCSGTDFVADTPNQADNTSGCPSGMVFDACSPVSPGILYQDYMDYSYDNCLVMFTAGQVARMQAAATTYRPGLFTSLGLQPPVLKNYDARLSTITLPAARVCTSTFKPAVTIRNVGSVTLTSLTINVAIDGTFVTSYNWTGSLPTLGDAAVTLNNVAASTGSHTLTIYTSNPNGQADQKTSNDTLSSVYTYTTALTPPITESFEGSTFPPAGWDIVNGDASYTWQKTNSAAKTGSSSVMIQNYYYGTYGAKDYLRLPAVSLSNADSAFVTFQVAAATYNPPGTPGNAWDTLQVVVSTDCGNTYTSLYKKWGDTLRTAPNSTVSFIPTPAQWRKDSVDISAYIGQGNILLAFLNTNENENNIYLDDINIYQKAVNPNLRAKGFMVTPNPVTGTAAVQFYPQPSNLRGIELYSMAGQKLAEIIVGSGGVRNYYEFNMSRFAAGVYVVRAVFSDKVVTQKMLKK